MAEERRNAARTGYSEFREIYRPYTTTAQLYISGPALLVDKRMVLAYRKLADYAHLDREGKPSVWMNLCIIRNSSLPVSYPIDGHERRLPNPGKLSQFSMVTAGLRATRPILHVGPRYQLVHLADNDSGILLNINSTHPLESEELAGNANYLNLLKSLDASKRI